MKEVKEPLTATLLARIAELESQLEDSVQLVEAIKAGEVDAFAINKDGKSEIFTLQSADYAYRLLIEEIGEGAINVTEEGLIVYTNTSFAHLVKLPYQSVIGSSIFDLISDKDKNTFTDLFKSALSGKSKGEINLAVNNQLIPVYVSLTSLLPRSATVGMVITDFTEKKRTEKIILDYQNDLEAKNAELVKNNENLASFVYVASHDLQEPLRKIQTFAARLLEREQNLSPTGKNDFDRMQAAAKRMQTLINDLLLYSRTNTVERKYENVNLGQIVETVKSDLKEEINEKQAIIETDKLCNAYVIAFQFHQLFYNLISNSLKFSIAGVPPHIKIVSEIVESSKTGLNQSQPLPHKQYCHIRITDNGIGFETDKNEKIFNIFVRLHGQSEYKGTGIGLAIVKKIIENHGGVITATAEPDKGATFDIYIPAAENPPSEN